MLSGKLGIMAALRGKREHCLLERMLTNGEELGSWNFVGDYREGWKLLSTQYADFKNNNKINSQFITTDDMSSSYFLGPGIYHFMKDSYQTK